MDEMNPVTAELSRRVRELEADVIVLREYLRAVISLLPAERLENDALASAARRINAIPQQEPQREEPIRLAHEQLFALSVHRIRPRTQP